jgi:predicted aldo/keto reductase-like oxidoreductase
MAEQDTTGVLSTDRRGFIGSTALLAGGALMFGEWKSAQAAGLPKRKLGRTGLNVTCLAFGSVALSDASQRRVLEHAIDSGVNYVHTCPGYTGGKAIGVVGEVMKTRRDKVYLAIKTEPGDIDRCLTILNTDHIDVLIPDSRNMSDAEREKYAKAREAGKIRFAGFAAHDNQESRLRDCIKAGWREVMLCAGVGLSAGLDAAIHDAAAAGMGIMAMKTNGGPGSFEQKITKLLSNPDLTCVTPGMLTIDHVDSAIAYVNGAVQANGAPLSPQRAVAACSGHCNFCGDCARACPQKIALMDYLRADLYRTRGDGDLARHVAENIPARHSVSACTGCAHCDHACGQHVRVQDTMRSFA